MAGGDSGEHIRLSADTLVQQLARCHLQRLARVMRRLLRLGLWMRPPLVPELCQTRALFSSPHVLTPHSGPAHGRGFVNLLNVGAGRLNLRVKCGPSGWGSNIGLPEIVPAAGGQ